LGPPRRPERLSQLSYQLGCHGVVGQSGARDCTLGVLSGCSRGALGVLSYPFWGEILLPIALLLPKCHFGTGKRGMGRQLGAAEEARTPEPAQLPARLNRLPARLNQSAGRSASTNSRASNGTRSSGPSPSPTSLMGMPSSLVIATAIPPLAVPSSLVRTTPVTPTASVN
jgi:hypothetical protein